MTHIFGIVGLGLNTAGALGLLRFVPNPDAGSPFPHETMQSLRAAMPEQRSAYARKVLAYRLSVAGLIAGFVLQLIDLLIA